VQRNKANYPGSEIKVKQYLCIAQSKRRAAVKGFPGKTDTVIAAKQEGMLAVWSNICG